MSPMPSPFRVTTTDLSDRELARACECERAKPDTATRKAYWHDFRFFGLWCQDHGFDVLPASPSAVAAYLSAEAHHGARPATIQRRRAAIRYVHRSGGRPSPTEDEQVRAVMRGIRRASSVAPRRVTPATLDHVAAMAPRPDGTLATLRDRALLLLGFAGGFRRSELVALDVADVEEFPNGLRVTKRRAKADQVADTVTTIAGGETPCPVTAVREWLAATGLSEGPLFRPIRRGGHIQSQRLTDRSVANIIKAHAARVGFESASFSGDSLRAGSSRGTPRAETISAQQLP